VGDLLVTPLEARLAQLAELADLQRRPLRDLIAVFEEAAAERMLHQMVDRVETRVWFAARQGDSAIHTLHAVAVETESVCRQIQVSASS
jgi:hypothetical protein